MRACPHCTLGSVHVYKVASGHVYQCGVYRIYVRQGLQDH